MQSPRAAPAVSPARQKAVCGVSSRSHRPQQRRAINAHSVVAPDVLTDQGILQRHAYSEHPPRYEYHLTDKGLALFPLIATMIRWSDDWAPNPDGPPVVLVHDTCGNSTQSALTCPHCHGEVSTANTHSEPGPGSRTTREGVQP